MLTIFMLVTMLKTALPCGRSANKRLQYSKQEGEKMHAERCPVCHGTGKIKEEYPKIIWDSSEKVCHGCYGRGWVTVGEKIPAFSPPKYTFHESFGI